MTLREAIKEKYANDKAYQIQMLKNAKAFDYDLDNNIYKEITILDPDWDEEKIKQLDLEGMDYFEDNVGQNIYFDYKIKK
jgi:hypothetical protein